MSNLSTRLSECRAALGITQSALAKQAGLKNQSIIGSLESGYRKASSHIPSIANALGVEPLWLAEGRGPKKRDLLPSSNTPAPEDEAEEARAAPTIASLLDGLKGEMDTLPESLKRAVADLVTEYLKTPDKETGKTVADAIERIVDRKS